ncbi:hypothetical protein ERN12_11120 [Rhodobacteraceae bacterium]|nr:hypothetical protein ERN12_11120 [Paracoccaceae bacterium]
MKWFSFIFFLLLAFPSVSIAKETKVISGEHEDFSRLVFMFDSVPDWSIDEDGSQYIFKVKGDEATYDIDDVFYYIPRKRILSVEPAMGGGLGITLAENMTINTFVLQDGPVVLDVKKRDEAKDPSPSSTLTPLVELPPIEVPIPGPDAYWRLSGSVSDTSNTSNTSNVPMPDAGRDNVPLAMESALDRERPRVQEAEAKLLEQLSRAASQGLISFKSPPATKQKLEVPPEQAPEDPEPVLPAHMAIRSQTAMDRDMANSLFAPLRGGDEACYADKWFALQDWVPEGDGFMAVGQRRRALLTEFDTPAPKAVRSLAQAYLALGFGAEARAVVNDFEMDARTRQTVNAIGAVIDNEDVALDNPVLQMAGCDTSAALWALLASPLTSLPADVNLQAVQRAYSDLPVVVRREVALPLAEKLKEFGAPEAAVAVHSALSRGEEAPSDTALLLEAKASSADTGDAINLTEVLAPVLQRDTQQSVEAMELIVADALRRKSQVDPLILDNAHALSVEMIPSEKGLSLLGLYITGSALNGDFEAAMAGLAEWPTPRDPTQVEETLGTVLELALEDLEDDALLLFYFQYRTNLLANPLSKAPRQNLAKRLIELGFGADAIAVLDTQRAPGRDNLILRARAALTERDGPTALAYVSDIEGEDVSDIRKQAYRMIGGIARPTENGLTPENSNLDTAVLDAEVAERFSRFQEAFTQAPPPAGPVDGAVGSARALLQQSAAKRTALSDLLETLR